MDCVTITLNDRQFKKICDLIYSITGIRLSDGKEELVKSRLAKRLRTLGLRNYDDYLELIEQDKKGSELKLMIDSLTTNKTSFFREMPHFDYLKSAVLPGVARKLRIWSAGCSTGEEPYSIAMLLNEELGGIDRMDVAILATDISTRVLAKARDGLFDEVAVQEIPRLMLGSYFAVEKRDGARIYRAGDRLRKIVTMAQLNLMDSWPMKGPFDVIFCRNVMIYFDKVTQNNLVNRFWELLPPGGHLFVGHSESFTGLTHRFRYVRPATYVK
jgi:chemotaxis protein methyltransferase CheR